MTPPYRPSGEKVPPPKKVQGEARGTVIVTLPADARLTVNGQPTRNTSAERRFITPPLPGEGTYLFRAEVERGGETIAREQRVVVRPGQETRVALDFASASIALAP